MTTVAIDTNALLAILYDDDTHADAAEAALRDAYRRGRLVIAPVVYGELAADGQFERDSDLGRFLRDMSIAVATPSREGLFHAGDAFETYTRRRPNGLRCPECGTERTATCPDCGRDLAPRQHITADFVIGGHALADADELVTFDRSFYESYFPDLSVTP
ncbi:MAG: type II toxin-antitoxin system VapC family toxin [Salinigranum sp.]